MKLPGSARDPLWYKDAIIYELHVRSFFDSTNDGVGDFRGLTQKLDYLQDLGITALWLLPFYPSPVRDDGYDIANYRAIHPSYGALRDFRQFLREAHERGIQVITELVVNHTSAEHPWFQAARRAPVATSKRNYYVWSETNRKYAEARIIFTDSEKSNWTWDDDAKAYYWHRFFHHQPDLNFDNPRVQRAMMKVMRFWFDMGVDGMRLDAVPYLIEREGTNCENLPETHAILRQFRRELDDNYANRMLLGEANQWPADVRPYFGDGDECHMAFHFPLMPRIFMALRQEDRHPITEILRQTPDIPDLCQWALFLRNHDEMTLEMVTDEERDYLYAAYAADPQMRLNVGIRRRLAPLVENSRRRIELLTSLLFSLPGTPIIYYGDEIGMGDNIYLGDRNGVRTPMQWTGDRNAGFSRADPARLFAPVIMDAVYGYQSINVEAQARAPFSLLNWMKRMIALRKGHKTFGRGTIEFLQPRNRKVLCYVRRYEDETILVVANLSRSVQPMELDLSSFKGLMPVEMLGRTEFPRVGEQPYFLTLSPYAFFWFQLERTPAPIAARVATQAPEAVEEIPALFSGGAWEILFQGNVRILIEKDCLRPFLRRQRWFGGKGREIESARFVDWGVLDRGHEPAFLTFVEVGYRDGGRDMYFLPLALRTQQRAEAAAKQAQGSVLARITGARKGVLFDAVWDDKACDALFNTIANSREVTTRNGKVQGFRTSAPPTALGAKSPDDGRPKISRETGEQSNTSIVFGDRLIMKLFRRLEPGPNPDVEICRYLTDVAKYTRVPALAGAAEYRRPGTEPAHLAMLQQMVSSQANGWNHAIDELRRYFDRTDGRAQPRDILEASDRPLLTLALEPPPKQVLEVIAGYIENAGKLGRRTAEAHVALARETSDPAIAPEPFSREDLARLAHEMQVNGRRALSALEAHLDRLHGTVQQKASAVLGMSDRLLTRFGGIAAMEPAFSKTRVHGDYHLGQVLWAEDDYIILDFEGEPARPLHERRAKQSPLKDVAGMLRSLSYAAFAGLFAETVNRPDEFDRLAAWAQVWQRYTSASFLRTYLATADCAPFLPRDPVALQALLEAFVLDKALYELHYELNHRPEWVRIPLWGIVPLAERAHV